jgi:hypothetical protein
MNCYYGNATIHGNPQYGNKFINNTMVQAKFRFNTGVFAPGAMDVWRMNDSSYVADGYPCDMTGTVFKNNLMISYDGPAIVIGNQRSDWLNTMVAKHNVMYMLGTPGNADRTMRWGLGTPSGCTVTAQSGCLEYGTGNDYYTLPEFEALSPTNISGNLNANPLFTHLDWNDWSPASTINYDFTLLAGSPGVSLGVADVDAPTHDLHGATRVGVLDAGVYQFTPTGGHNHRPRNELNRLQ